MFSTLIFVSDFEGVICETSHNDCVDAGFGACQNGGTCVDGIREYFCECPLGKTGPACDKGEIVLCANIKYCIDQSFKILIQTW